MFQLCHACLPCCWPRQVREHSPALTHVKPHPHKLFYTFQTQTLLTELLDTGKRSGPFLFACMHTASMLQPNPKCTEFSVGDGAQQPRGQEEREAREVERKKMEAPTSPEGKSMRAHGNGGATSSGGAMNSLCGLLVTSTLSSYVLS